MTNTIIDFLGWIGSLLLISAYYQNSRNKINAQSFIYQLLNVMGSIFLIVNTIYYGAYPSSAINIIWVVIGMRFLIKNAKNNATVH